MKNITTIATILFLAGCGSSTTIVDNTGLVGEAGSGIDETGGTTGGNLETGGTPETGGSLETGGTTGGLSETGGNFNTGGTDTGGNLPTGGNVTTGGNPGTGGQEIDLPTGCQLASPDDDIDPSETSFEYNDCRKYFESQGAPQSVWRWQLTCCPDQPPLTTFDVCRFYAYGPYPEANPTDNKVYIDNNRFMCQVVSYIDLGDNIDAYCCRDLTEQ